VQLGLIVNLACRTHFPRTVPVQDCGVDRGLSQLVDGTSCESLLEENDRLLRPERYSYTKSFKLKRTCRTRSEMIHMLWAMTT